MCPRCLFLLKQTCILRASSWLHLLLSHLKLPSALTSAHPFLKHLPPLSSKASISPASPVTSLINLSRSFVNFLPFDAEDMFPPKFRASCSPLLAIRILSGWLHLYLWLLLSPIFWCLSTLVTTGLPHSRHISNCLLDTTKEYLIRCAYLGCLKVKVAQLCPTLCDPMDYTVHGILLARILKWVAFPFSRGFSQPRDQTQVSSIAGGFFTSWTTGHL